MSKAIVKGAQALRVERPGCRSAEGAQAGGASGVAYVVQRRRSAADAFHAAFPFRTMSALIPTRSRHSIHARCAIRSAQLLLCPAEVGALLA